MKALRNVGLVLVFLFVLTALPVMAEANSWTVVTREDFTGQLWSDCIGGPLDFGKTTHKIEHYTSDASGGYHYVLNVHDRGTAVDSATGDEWKWSFKENLSEQLVNYPTECPKNRHVEASLMAVGKGRAPSLKCHGIWQITFNANCESTVDFKWYECECK